MFVDMVSSSEFGSVLSVKAYAEYVRSFQETCIAQCEYFFHDLHSEIYQSREFACRYRAAGDELMVIAHTDDPANDAYHLVCLALTLKCSWLQAQENIDRLASGMASTELAIGIHSGTVWAVDNGQGHDIEGFSINVAKRAESLSRRGTRTNLVVTDPTYKLLARRTRNLLFGPRSVSDMKGILVPMATRELVAAFVNPVRRMYPGFRSRFREAAALALTSNALDSWIHSCLQVCEEQSTEKVSDESMARCATMLAVDPYDPVSLYYAAQGWRERDDLIRADLYLDDLVRHWPNLGDAWLERARVAVARDRPADAQRFLLEALRRDTTVDAQQDPLLHQLLQGGDRVV
ncbi:MAG TPA: adenylate/guanylate cyclase domain-containing protein [Candidatus Binatia bacterium]|nr:adenylate/guanylate cyclase domain-containing protein [Candidatus Binatia bacterium]